MPSASYHEARVESAFEDTLKDYASRNPKSEQVHQETRNSLPGGTTRNVIHFKPFPLVIASGQESYITDVDGHKYLDLCGEYSAGLFGHSDPVVKRAMHDAIDDGFALGGVNLYEGRLANLVTQRFKTMDKVRFSNSGTEANMTALALVKAYTDRNTIIVFQGAYHGGLLTFLAKKGKSMNAPHKFVMAQYNDIQSLNEAVDANKDDLACIMMELMQGSAGCIPADQEFIQACRDRATETGAVLMFDEVMTSRMSIYGYQDVVGIYPDMTTLGKYYGGGGQNFGAFGGKDEIMSMIEPDHPNGVYHSGTYNNNVTTMATATAVLEKVWTAEVAANLFDMGVWLKDELNRIAKEKKSTLVVSGVGSLLNVHFSEKEIRTSADVQSADLVLREVFFFDMLLEGFFLARRGMISLMTTHTKEELQSFIDATEQWLEKRKDLVGYRK